MFSNMYLSRYNSDSLEYQCQHKATIPVTIDPKSKGTILNLFFKTGNHSDTISWSINTTTTGRDLVINPYQAFN